MFRYVPSIGYRFGILVLPESRSVSPIPECIGHWTRTVPSATQYISPPPLGTQSIRLSDSPHRLSHSHRLSFSFRRLSQTLSDVILFSQTLRLSQIVKPFSQTVRLSVFRPLFSHLPVSHESVLLAALSAGGRSNGETRPCPVPRPISSLQRGPAAGVPGTAASSARCQADTRSRIPIPSRLNDLRLW